jgi:hypothetical protein
MAAAAAVIDPAKTSLVNRIPLQAHPEGFQLDSERRRAFVNVSDAHQIAVVDLEACRQSCPAILYRAATAGFHPSCPSSQHYR